MTLPLPSKLSLKMAWRQTSCVVVSCKNSQFMRKKYQQRYNLKYYTNFYDQLMNYLHQFAKIKFNKQKLEQCALSSLFKKKFKKILK